MEARYVLWLVKKWYLLIILSAVIGGAVSLGVNHFIPKTYQSTATLYVSSLSGSDYQSELGAQQAAKALALFPQSDAVLEATLAGVRGRSLNLDQLTAMVTVLNNLDSQFVVINVRNGNPGLAAQLASAIANQSIAQFMASQTNNAQYQQFIQQQLASLQTEINDLSERLAQVQLGSPTPAQTANVNLLNTRLSSDRVSYSQLLGSVTGGSGFRVTVVQQPQIPQKPAGMGLPIVLAIGILVGLVVIVCVMLFVEQTRGIVVIRLGDRLSVLDQETGLPTMITVKEMPAVAEPEQKEMPAVAEPEQKEMPPVERPDKEATVKVRQLVK